MNYLENFKKEKNLIERFKEENAYLCWVMALYLDRNDVYELGTDNLTDGKNDRKIDFIDLDIGNERITLAQGYYSKKDKDEAPANKASDMNTALAWLLSGDMNEIPEYLRSIIAQCREAIKNNEISCIDAVYVHNLSESKNCKNELDTIQKHQSKLFESYNIEIETHELGKQTTENLYMSRESQILIKDKIEMEEIPLFAEKSDGWDAYVFSVSGKWLFELYNKYGDDLFSANYRGFLGIGKRKKINNLIRQTVEMEPTNFWVYNNGITILTLGVEEDKNKKIISGLSVINGAQTTGSISMVEDSKKSNLEDVKVLCRVIKCNDINLIPKIVKSNNTQNEITSWDRYSNDPIQLCLKEEFKKYGKEYSLKRGFDDTTDSFGIYTIAQPTLAFEGNYSEANRGKNNIFKNNYLYRSVFEDKRARHLLLVYSLAQAVDEVKYEIKDMTSKKEELKDDEIAKLAFFRNLKFKMFLIAIIAECLDSIVDFKVDKKTIALSEVAAQDSLESIKNKWKKFVNSILTILGSQIKIEEINEYISDKEKFEQLCKTLKALISVLQTSSATKFDELTTSLWKG